MKLKTAQKSKKATQNQAIWVLAKKIQYMASNDADGSKQ